MSVFQHEYSRLVVANKLIVKMNAIQGVLEGFCVSLNDICDKFVFTQFKMSSFFKFYSCNLQRTLIGHSKWKVYF